MKKYLYTLSLLGLIVYSCKTQTQTTVAKTETASSTVSSSHKDVLVKGEELYNQRCGKCHELPAASAFTVEEWKPIMAAMIPKSELTTEEGNWVLAYANHNAKK